MVPLPSPSSTHLKARALLQHRARPGSSQVRARPLLPGQVAAYLGHTRRYMGGVQVMCSVTGVSEMMEPVSASEQNACDGVVPCRACHCSHLPSRWELTMA